MTITDIIGEGKIFEPLFSPHSVASPYIIDANRKIVASIDYTSLEHLRFPTRCEVRGILAQHICDLLNKEHGEGGNQRYQLLSQCCDVVRNTNLSEDIKSHLINTFMRL